MYVHNLSAVGEQYLDFEPADDKGPYAEDGDTLDGRRRLAARSTRATCWSSSNAFVSSVDKENLQVLVRELGTMFDGHRRAAPAAARQRQHVHRRGLGAHRRDPRAARRRAHRAADPAGRGREHPRLLPRPAPRSPSRSRTATPTCAPTLSDTPATARELDALLNDLEPTLPVLLGQRDQRQPGRADPPRRARAAARDLPAGHRGRVHRHHRRRLRPRQPAVRQQRRGRAPRATSRRNEWRPPSDLSDGPIFPAQCTAGPPYVQRGTPYSPDGQARQPRARPTAGRYDPTSGIIDGVVDANGNPVHLGDQGNLSVLGGDSWKWLLVGPVVATP